ncbi:membrane protein [Clostridium novyi A str. 4552]|uniref:Membrane protein n=1 Tax=Clostridium novyi A str. 4552 TaxID=1444289 RepID=A0A0A0I6X7_CLONO|nr:ABC-2 transporter permease [Clostridium novyi]KGM96328.1 membrane protein [Clostridium novyi A str. 4552]
MRSLISKDIIIAKRNIIIAMILCTIFSISWAYSKEISGVLNILSLATFVSICTQGSNGYDDLNKSYMMIASLPTTREKIVNSKYVQVLFYLIIGGILIILTNTILKLLNIVSLKIIYINLIGLLLGSIFVFLYYSLYYPLYFKLGNKYISHINQMIFALLILSPSFILKVLKKHPQMNITKFIMEFNIKSLIFILVFSIIVFFTSSRISQNIYNNRELS